MDDLINDLLGVGLPVIVYDEKTGKFVQIMPDDEPAKLDDEAKQ